MRTLNIDIQSSFHRWGVLTDLETLQDENNGRAMCHICEELISPGEHMTDVHHVEWNQEAGYFYRPRVIR